ncbi:hypothetical protein EPUS_08449 [Endocarpon pusillum Z07020]|uniref:Uncharacterized protein n=1 Tax=Endocarpon pusillum (strain Z07020 / HMAS-L-300199) TaxID=1263415 RepID=U1I0X9_ENDPU|nr:uncharacterized protein EPUS_08449 [Endocarpon pusillum Z07020]ERF75544.1 hypothetical protein EPUS_08449 [Endocarpon pusillum Z07020]
MSDSITIPGGLTAPIATLPEKFFPFLSLPYELRNRIYHFVAVRPDGYIGQADNQGGECTIGRIQARLQAHLPKTVFDKIHVPINCLHPDHEKMQLAKDFRNYGCLNITHVCRQMHKEFTPVFFERNGFELRDASAFIAFVVKMQAVHTSLIRKLRIYHTITLNTDDIQAIFGQLGGISGDTFYCLLEDNYLNDATSCSALLHVLRALIESCNSLQQFDLVYRLEVPAEHFHVLNALNTPYITQHAQSWRGEPMRWDLHTKNVLQKLRQDEKMRQDDPIAVEVEEFKTNDFTNQVATASGRRQLFFDVYADAMTEACLSHAEELIEDVVQNRTKEAP